jgi:predicted DNA-binding protein
MGKEKVEMQSISFKIPAEIYEAFFKLCKTRGTTMTTCLRELIDDFLAAQGESTSPFTEQLNRIETKIDNITALDTAILRTVIVPASN